MRPADANDPAPTDTHGKQQGAGAVVNGLSWGQLGISVIFQKTAVS
jgi:hypothetical protein